MPVQVAAWYISVSPYTLNDWLKAGLLPSVSIELPAGQAGRRGDRFRKTLVRPLVDVDQFIAQAKSGRLEPLPVKPPRKKLTS